MEIAEKPVIMSLTWAGASRAGEGNRTLMTSLKVRVLCLVPDLGPTTVLVMAGRVFMSDTA
jgi:hypothetical protein